ncbi:hypothetical protein GOM44_04325 [Wolbachia endosymbiont of Atemnus politus]|uniref:hypothetical protein n=1 Tax=Wolbachia endosymbiont of Atemnus politus TaxID=2682840 RepID=UPI001574DF55|nr:hypothetical protein [Wolbachia endosymbiont of Atemnus politus]NSX83561.1 hypothetical protein [Wolbachia endosymbiont of Atemnus politus]
MAKLKDANERNIIYESVHSLTDLQKERILKLARMIERGDGIAEKFKNRWLTTNYIPSKTLNVRITYENETFTLLHHAICHENSQAVKDIIEEAKNKNLLNEVA